MPQLELILVAGQEPTMECTRLGNTGLNVSRICFGCMWFGRPVNGGIDVRFCFGAMHLPMKGAEPDYEAR